MSKHCQLIDYLKAEGGRGWVDTGRKETPRDINLHAMGTMYMSVSPSLSLKRTWTGDFPGGPDGKKSTCSAGDLGSIPGLGRSPGGGHGNPLQYSCLENPHGQRSLAGYSPWGHKESDTTERPNMALVVWWLRIHLWMQGTWVPSLVQVDPTCLRTTKPMHHNCWASAFELMLCKERSPHIPPRE